VHVTVSLSVRHPFLDHPAPLAFAHRGGAVGGPENSLAAFERATRLGYRYLETDARVTLDGVLLAFHDAHLDRTTDASGALAELPWRVVRTARLGGRERIARLEELFGAFPEARFNVDVKTPAAVRPFVEAVRRTGAWDRVCAAAFSEARLLAVRRAAGPRLATSLGPRSVVGLRLRSFTGGFPVDRLLGAATRRSAVCVQAPACWPPYPAERSVPLIDERFVRTAHRLGLQVHVWTEDDPARIRRLLDLGVDGIMSDRIDVLRDILIERGAWHG
jgi:glycerophosphoryl diester phosphodiesterase